MSQLANSFSPFGSDESNLSPFDRLPPHSIDAEMCLLASMTLDKDLIGEAVQRVQRESFYLADHQIVFDALVELWQNNRPIDAVILRDELGKRQLLEEIGGAAYIAELLGSVPSSAHGMHYAGIVREKALLRQLIDASNKCLQDAYAPHESVEQVMDRAEKRIFEIAQQKVTGEITSLGSVAESVYEMLEDRGRRRADDRLRGHGRDAARPPAGRDGHRRRPAEHGQDGLRHERGGKRGGQERAGRCLLAGNEQAAARPADDVQPRRPGRAAGSQGDAPQRGVPKAGDDGHGACQVPDLGRRPRPA